MESRGSPVAVALPEVLRTSVALMTSSPFDSFDKKSLANLSGGILSTPLAKFSAVSTLRPTEAACREKVQGSFCITTGRLTNKGLGMS